MTRTDARPGPPQTRLHFPFLDGLRGLAALYVLLFHIRLRSHFPDTPKWFETVQNGVGFGHYAVCVFIVLSGFCLMMPVARSSSGQLRGGLREFVRRRARRILPPYFAALVICIAWNVVLQSLKASAGKENRMDLELSPGNLLTHALLIFNWFPQYWGATNGAFWSVASEWQIYFVFALVLLPVWQRWGIAATLVLAFALGVGVRYLLPAGPVLEALNRACSWFILLFALGMAGAVVRCAPGAENSIWLRRVPWGVLGAAIFGVLVALHLLVQPIGDPWHPTLVRDFTWISDTLCGLATLCLILWCSTHDAVAPTPARAWLMRLLEGRWLVGLGAFSYSLYLIHLPVLDLTRFVTARLPLPGLVCAFLLWVGGVAFALGVARLFWHFFERPFLASQTARSA